LTDETATVALTDAVARIEAIARLYRTMREQSAAARIDFGRYLTTLGAEMSASTGLHCNVQTEPIVLDSKTAMNLAVAATELVLNASKHAYQAKPGGIVDVICKLVDGGNLLLSVADHGRGVPPGFDPERTRGLGLSYVVGLTQMLGGWLEVATKGLGACFTITVPLSPDGPEHR
jgi:two-component sensor histidine kinase